MLHFSNNIVSILVVYAFDTQRAKLKFIFRYFMPLGCPFFCDIAAIMGLMRTPLWSVRPADTPACLGRQAAVHILQVYLKILGKAGLVVYSIRRW
jgi:hypothetical protein